MTKQNPFDEVVILTSLSEIEVVLCAACGDEFSFAEVLCESCEALQRSPREKLAKAKAKVFGDVGGL